VPTEGLRRTDFLAGAGCIWGASRKSCFWDFGEYFTCCPCHSRDNFWPSSAKPPRWHQNGRGSLQEFNSQPMWRPIRCYRLRSTSKRGTAALNALIYPRADHLGSAACGRFVRPRAPGRRCHAFGDRGATATLAYNPRIRMELTVVTPTFNEAANVERFVRSVSGVLRGVEHEIVIADDDSPDQTWLVAGELTASFPGVRVLRRVGQRNLAASVIDGFCMATGDAVVCIDADLQHDPAILPTMLAELRSGSELVVGCRYMPGGGTTNWSRVRRLESWVATRMAQAYLGLKLRDPMSGYFMVWRQDFMAVRQQLSGQGFKILIEIAVRLWPQRICEVPYVFGPRIAGTSKLTAAVAVDYMAQLRRLRATASASRSRAIG
jgi:hypothetical protein